MKRIRRAIGLTLGDLAYDRDLMKVASFCYHSLAMYPKLMRGAR